MEEEFERREEEFWGVEEAFVVPAGVTPGTQC